MKPTIFKSSSTLAEILPALGAIAERDAPKQTGQPYHITHYIVERTLPHNTEPLEATLIQVTVGPSGVESMAILKFDTALQAQAELNRLADIFNADPNFIRTEVPDADPGSLH